MQKVSHMLFIVSLVALGYVIYATSPLLTVSNKWENSYPPALFYLMVVIFIFHAVWTSRKLKQESYKKVNWISILLMILCAFTVVPGLFDMIVMLPRLIEVLFR